MRLAPEILVEPGAHCMSMRGNCSLLCRPFTYQEALMWFLIATMLVMGHHVKIHVEKFETQQACEDRKEYVKDRLEKRDVVILMVCETSA